MWVYIWTDSLEINSDLVNSSLDQLKSEWWDDITVVRGSAGYTIWAEGLKWGWSSSANNQQVSLWKEIPSLWDHIVEVNWQGTATRAYSTHNWQYNCFVNCGLYTSALDVSANNFQWGYNTWTNDHGYIGINEWWSLLWNTSTTFSWWNVNFTTKINLKTWLIEYSCTSPITFSSTYTLNSTQLATAMTYKYVGFGGIIYDWGANYITISKASLKVTPA